MVIQSWMRAGFALLGTLAAGAITALFVGNHTIAWFNALQKPLFFNISLEAILFIAIATYLLIGIAASIIWIQDPRPHDFRGWMPLFFDHLLMNMAWMILFFGYNVPFVSMLIIFWLAFFVGMLVCEAWNRNVLSFYFLLPYFAWILYALGMNIAVWMMN
jgi:translocator protein